MADNEFTQLLSRIHQGDDVALTELLHGHEAVLRRSARALIGRPLRPHLDSMDLVQSVYRTLLLGIRGQKFVFSSPAEFLALALTVVRRKVARQWRKTKREGPAPAEYLGAQLDPASALHEDEALRNLFHHIDDETDRRLLELRLEGHTTAEAARRMGVEPGYLRVRLGRLRRLLTERGLLTDWL